MADYDYRRFDDIPDGTVFADKYGRVYTKQSAGRATEHTTIFGDGYAPVLFDTSREYFDYDEETAEDAPFVFDTWPYYALPDVQPMPACHSHW
jgi:hypothetical protein